MSIFSQVKMSRPKSNTFNLSHDKKMSMNFGNLTPFLCMETIPGDRFKMSTSQMVRLAPMAAPLMAQINVYTHFFFVPNRILWPNWENFITGGEDGLDQSVFPTVTIEGLPNPVEEGTLLDYLGLPAGSTASPQPYPSSNKISAMPMAGYQKIFIEYYRDQNLFPKFDVELTDGDNAANFAALTGIRNRAWQHDYFTSALPFQQKGPEATIPIGGVTDVNFVDDTLQFPVGPSNQNMQIREEGATGTIVALPTTGGQLEPIEFSQATAASINDLRNAFRLQEWLEKNARGGSRYNEAIMVHFGVNAGDARLQRPEYLGGGATPVQISEVLQTSQSAFSEGTLQPATPQGNMAGHGISVGANNGFSYSVKEHGYIFGIMSVIPKSGYQNGIPRHWKKFDKFDYAFPSFAHLGEQPIYNYELWLDEADALEDETFGYLPRYAEYKNIPSSVAGEYRTSLDYWHLSRKFNQRPVLNDNFIRCRSAEMDRVFAVTDPSVDKLYVHVYNRIKARRPLPYFGTPKGV